MLKNKHITYRHTGKKNYKTRTKNAINYVISKAVTVQQHTETCNISFNKKTTIHLKSEIWYTSICLYN